MEGGVSRDRPLRMIDGIREPLAESAVQEHCGRLFADVFPQQHESIRLSDIGDYMVQAVD